MVEERKDIHLVVLNEKKTTKKNSIPTIRSKVIQDLVTDFDPLSGEQIWSFLLRTHCPKISVRTKQNVPFLQYFVIYDLIINSKPIKLYIFVIVRTRRTSSKYFFSILKGHNSKWPPNITIGAKKLTLLGSYRPYCTLQPPQSIYFFNRQNKTMIVEYILLPYKGTKSKMAAKQNSSNVQK